LVFDIKVTDLASLASSLLTWCL